MRALIYKEMNILEVYKTKYFDDYDKKEEQEEMLKSKKEKEIH